MTPPAMTRVPVKLDAAVTGAAQTRAAVCEYAPNAFDRCGKTFTQTHVFGQWAPSACPECVKLQIAADDQKRAAEETENRRKAALASLDVPLLYRDVSLANFRSHGDEESRRRQARVLQLAYRYVANWPDRQNLDSLGAFPIVAVFRGAPGSGKGHVAWSIAKHVALEELGRVVFTTLADCVRDLRETWRSDSDATENQRLRRYRRADLLVLDEVSKHAFYGEPTQHLYSLVAYREERLLPTILTTNETPEALAELLGPALESRAASWGGVWQFGEADYREQRRNVAREAA